MASSVRRMLHPSQAQGLGESQKAAAAAAVPDAFASMVE